MTTASRARTKEDIAGRIESEVNEAMLTEPMPLDLPQTPPFVDGLLPGFVNDMARAVSEFAETAYELPAAFALGILSTAVQGKFQICAEKGYFEQLSLWPCPVALSGERKSAVLGQLSAPLTDWEMEKSANMAEQAAIAEATIKVTDARIKQLKKDAEKGNGDIADISKEIADLEASKPDVPRAPRLITGDITSERLASLMAEQSERMAIISDEASIFDMLQGRYSDGMAASMDIFLQGYTGAFVRVDRGSRPPVILNRPSLTFCVSPQPGVLEGLTAKRPELRSRGLIGRFLYIMPERRIGKRKCISKPIPDEVSASWSRGIKALLDAPMDVSSSGTEWPWTIKLTSDAHGLWKDAQRRIESHLDDDGDLEMMRDFGGKLPGTILRIAGLFHCVETVDTLEPRAIAVTRVSKETMARAIRLSETLTMHAKAAFALMGTDNGTSDAQHVLDWIIKNRKPLFKLRDCYRALRSRFSRVANLDLPLDVLCEHGHIAEIISTPGKLGGRPSRAFEVNRTISANWG